MTQKKNSKMKTHNKNRNMGFSKKKKNMKEGRNILRNAKKKEKIYILTIFRLEGGRGPDIDLLVQQSCKCFNLHFFSVTKISSVFLHMIFKRNVITSPVLCDLIVLIVLYESILIFYLEENKTTAEQKKIKKQIKKFHPCYVPLPHSLPSNRSTALEESLQIPPDSRSSCTPLKNE